MNKEQIEQVAREYATQNAWYPGEHLMKAILGQWRKVLPMLSRQVQTGV